jgi:hypothetical protein
LSAVSYQAGQSAENSVDLQENFSPEREFSEKLDYQPAKLLHQFNGAERRRIWVS